MVLFTDCLMFFFIIRVGTNLAFSFLSSMQYRTLDSNASDTENYCADHNHELLKPGLTSTWMPHAVGSVSQKSAVFAETQVNTKTTLIV